MHDLDLCFTGIVGTLAALGALALMTTVLLKGF